MVTSFIESKFRTLVEYDAWLVNEATDAPTLATSLGAHDASYIDARHRGLQELPADNLLLRFTALRHLDLAHNLLVSLPSALGLLPSLEVLDVSHNLLETLPLELALHATLQLLAAHNPLRLELPPLPPAGGGSSHPSLFCDPDFEPGAGALGRADADADDADAAAAAAGVRWLRPAEICAAASEPPPELFVESSASSDVVQGALGDCWFLSAVAVIALHRDGEQTRGLGLWVRGDSDSGDRIRGSGFGVWSDGREWIPLHMRFRTYHIRPSNPDLRAMRHRRHARGQLHCPTMERWGVAPRHNR